MVKVSVYKQLSNFIIYRINFYDVAMTNIGISHVLYRKKQKILMLRKFCDEVICFSGLFILLLKLRIMSLLLE